MVLEPVNDQLKVISMPINLGHEEKNFIMGGNSVFNTMTERRTQMMSILADMKSSSEFGQTLYLTDSSRHKRTDPMDWSSWKDLVILAPDRGTGIVIFRGRKEAVAVAPPFPILQNSVHGKFEADPLIDLFAKRVTVGVILLRLGYYAIAVLQGENILTSKVGTRYVKNRHRKGGSSQRRFERSRDRLVRELFDKVCLTADQLFDPFKDKLDYLFLGGEKHTLSSFERRCSYLKGSQIQLMRRRLMVNRPGSAALAGIYHEIWKSDVCRITDQNVVGGSLGQDMG